MINASLLAAIAGGGAADAGFLDSIDGLLVAAQWDATKTASYSGSGQTWANLIATPSDGETQADYDCHLGAGSGSSTDDPTFVGTAGTDSAKWTLDGGDFFACKNTGLLAMAKAHRTDYSDGTWIAFVGLTQTGAGGFMSNTDAFADGVTLRKQSGPQVRLQVTGGAVLSSGGSALPNDVAHVVICTWDSSETSGTVSKVYINSDTPETTSSTTFNTSTADRNNALMIGARGDLAQILASGSEIYGMALGQGFLTDALAASIRQWYNDNHAQTY